MSQRLAGPDDVRIPQLRWRLASKITLSIGSVFVMLALIVTIMTFVQVRQRAYADLELQAAALADALNFTFEVLVSQDQATTLQRVAENSATIPGVRKIVIVDRAQQVLASSNRLDVDTALTAGPLRDFIAQRTRQRRTSLNEQNELVIIQPLRGGRFGGQEDGDIVGAIQIIVDTSRAEATARTTALQYLGVILGSYLLLSLILAVILRLLVVGPIQQLATAAQSFGKGRRSQRSQLRRRDEFGLLAATFDAMAAEVEQLVTGLEAQVAARTIDLEQERTQLALALADLAEERALLIQRVAERTAELSTANAALARTARLKDEFLASMSHELRTPLNAVLGLSEALQEEIYGPLNARQRQSLHSIEESGRHLLALINDILDLAKIGAGQLVLTIEPIELIMIAQQSLRLIGPMAHDKNLQVIERFDSTVGMLLADARCLKQILINLLSNAVKFTPDGGTIGLEVSADTARQTVQMTVWDTGIGIATEHMELLFQPFVQIDGRLSRQYAGTGLGLSLVARMTELHGGNITVTSTVGRGSRFTVSLPWDEGSAAQWTQADGLTEMGEYSSPTAQPAQRPCILVAEDNLANLTMLVDYLTVKEYQVVVANDGAEAIAQTRAACPDLILMDIQMPGMDGLEAIRRIRTDSARANVPIIALTALAMPDDRERCLAAGATTFLSRPVRLQELVRTIEEQLTASQSALP